MTPTCPTCASAMTYLDPGNPPRWIEAWACDCGRRELTTLANPEEIVMTVSVTTACGRKEGT